MFNKLVVLFFFSMFATHCFSTPKWFLKSYSERENEIIGKGSQIVENNNEAAALNKARNYALKDAATSIFCYVTGNTVQINREQNYKSEETFINEVEIKTKISLVDYSILKSQIKSNVAFTIISIDKENLRNFYRNNVLNFIKNIHTNYQLAEDQIIISPEKALSKYNECLALIKLMDNDLAIYLSLNNWNNDLADDLTTLPDIYTLEMKFNKLTLQHKLDTSSIATSLVEYIVLNYPDAKSITIYPLEYDNTGFVSNFGRYFKVQLEKLFSKPISTNSFSEKPELVISGNIFELNNGILIVNKMSFKSGKTDNIKQFFINKSECDKIGWKNIRPQNFEQAINSKKVLYSNVQRDNRLKVDLRLDEMDYSPIVLYYGDKPKLYIKVNKPCYLRLIYIFSDDTKTLLFDNYKLSEEQSNTWTVVPVELEVCEPSGIEQMLVQTSTELMPEIVTNRISVDGGYIDVIEDLQSEVQKTRGLKILKPEKEITERIYQWSVFEN